MAQPLRIDTGHSALIDRVGQIFERRQTGRGLDFYLSLYHVRLTASRSLRRRTRSPQRLHFAQFFDVRRVA